MSANETKFLNELENLFESYSVDEVRCEERDGAKFIVFYSNGRYLAFRLFKEGTFYEILSLIPEYNME